MVIGIDPGTEQSAYVVWNGIAITDMNIWDNNTVLSYLGTKGHYLEIESLIIEDIRSYGMPVGKSTLETVFWIGRFCERWSDYGEFHRIPRKEICKHICNNGRAKDPNIRQALIDRFGPPGTQKAQGVTYGLKYDLWSAFAVAVTGYDQKCR